VSKKKEDFSTIGACVGVSVGVLFWIAIFQFQPWAIIFIPFYMLIFGILFAD